VIIGFDSTRPSLYDKAAIANREFSGMNNDMGALGSFSDKIEAGELPDSSGSWRLPGEINSALY
jgi:hypothetical protein